MIVLDHRCDPRSWAEEHFGSTMFSDVRRVERAVTIAAAMAANPGASIPRMFTRWYDTKAAYAFFGHWEVDAQMLQAGHRDLVVEAMRSPGTYLLIEDTTEMDYSSREPMPGLGPIGNSNTSTQGFLLHTTLGVRWPILAGESGHRPAVTVLGMCDQQFHIRTPRPEGEPDRSIARKDRERESQVWERASTRIGLAEEGARWVRVCDAGADIYEHLMRCAEYGHGHVIRAAQDRALAGPDGRSHAGRLYATLRAQPALGSFEVDLYARKGRPARTATMSVSAMAIRLRSPQRPGKAVGYLPPVPCTAVRVWEATPPEGQEGVEWILLCDAPAETFEQARECAAQYATRGLIEEFHKALKTGLGAERLQMETGERLFAAVAMMSVVALRLLEVREAVRRDPDAPAETSGLDETELKVLRAVTDRRLRTVRDVALAIGRLGGHLNRTRDGMPGWQTLWHGFTKLQLLCEGVRLAKKVERFG
jgi:hypothetical protein